MTQATWRPGWRPGRRRRRRRHRRRRGRRRRRGGLFLVPEEALHRRRGPARRLEAARQRGPPRRRRHLVHALPPLRRRLRPRLWDRGLRLGRRRRRAVARVRGRVEQRGRRPAPPAQNRVRRLALLRVRADERVEGALHRAVVAPAIRRRRLRRSHRRREGGRRPAGSALDGARRGVPPGHVQFRVQFAPGAEVAGRVNGAGFGHAYRPRGVMGAGQPCCAPWLL